MLRRESRRSHRVFGQYVIVRVNEYVLDKLVVCVVSLF